MPLIQKDVCQATQEHMKSEQNQHIAVIRDATINFVWSVHRRIKGRMLKDPKKQRMSFVKFAWKIMRGVKPLSCLVGIVSVITVCNRISKYRFLSLRPTICNVHSHNASLLSANDKLKVQSLNHFGTNIKFLNKTMQWLWIQTLVGVQPLTVTL